MRRVRTATVLQGRRSWPFMLTICAKLYSFLFKGPICRPVLEPRHGLFLGAGASVSCEACVHGFLHLDVARMRRPCEHLIINVSFLSNDWRPSSEVEVAAALWTYNRLHCLAGDVLVLLVSGLVGVQG